VSSGPSWATKQDPVSQDQKEKKKESWTKSLAFMKVHGGAQSHVPILEDRRGQLSSVTEIRQVRLLTAATSKRED
jgi:hypothetical protein